MIKSTLTIVGKFQNDYNQKLNINLPILDIYQDLGLYKHVKSNHPNCIQYLNKISDILISPDYIGQNPKVPNSVELIKNFGDNLQIAIKLDFNNNYYYIATLHEISNVKINKRLNNGRLKKFQENTWQIIKLIV